MMDVLLLVPWLALRALQPSPPAPAAAAPQRAPATASQPAPAPASQPAPAAASQPATAPAAEPAPPGEPEPTDAELEAQFGDVVAADRAEAAAAREASTPGSAAPAGITSAALTNPEISAIGVFAGTFWVRDRAPTFDAHDDPHGVGASVQELELSLAADVDPYFRMRAFLALQEASIEIEEAYALTTALPHSLLFKGGVFRSSLGRNNELHLHQQDFARRPPTIQLLGEDGLKAPGGQLSVLLPLPWFATLAGEVLSLADEPSAVLALEQYVDLGPCWSLLVGTGGGLLYRTVGEGHDHAHEAGAEADEAAGDGEVAAAEREYLVSADVYLKWMPPNVTRTYAWVAATAEYVAARHVDGDAWDGAAYAQVVAQVARRWRAGLRLGLTGLPEGDRLARELVAAGSVAFLASEYSRVRLTVEHQRDLEDAADNNQLLILQLEAAIGAHASHPF